MNRTLLFLTITLFWFTTANTQVVTNYSPTRLIIQLQPNINSERFFETSFYVEHEFTFRQLRSKVKTDIYFVDFVNEVPILEIVERFKTKSEIAVIEPDYIGYGDGQMMQEPNDPLYKNRQYGLENNGTFSLMNAKADADIDMEKAWDYGTGCDDVVIAILDSGANMNSPEIKSLIWENDGEFLTDADDDGNGYKDDVRGWDFVHNDSDPTDFSGHGTNVSGIVSAIGDNGIGYAGVNWSSRSMQVKVLDNENVGYFSWFAEGIYYAVDNGANVINMSLGGSSYSAIFHEAVKYAYDNDVAAIASMGNADMDVLHYPASFAETIAVGATDAEDNRVSPFSWDAFSGSSFGEHIDVVAPGHYIYGLSFYSNTNFDSYWGGTSQSAPLVTGVVSLMYCTTGSYQGIIEDVRETIRNTADDQVGKQEEDVEGFDIYYGYGRLNAGNALQSWSPVLSSEDVSLYTMKISPNPSSGGIVEVAWDMPQVTKLIIYSVEGRITREFKVDSSTSQLVSDLPAGTYVAKIVSNKSILSKKLIVH